MTSTFPNWVLYLQALLTPAIALLAAVIGYVQWRTAHQRAVLDVFEKRFEIYQSATATITEVIRKDTVQPHAHIDFLRATDKAQFLFGPEVTSYFNYVRITRRAWRSRGSDEERTDISKRSGKEARCFPGDR